MEYFELVVMMSLFSLSYCCLWIIAVDVTRVFCIFAYVHASKHLDLSKYRWKEGVANK